MTKTMSRPTMQLVPVKTEEQKGSPDDGGHAERLVRPERKRS